MKKRILVRGAKQLLTLRGPSGPRRGCTMSELGLISDGALLIENGQITHVGPARRIENLAEAKEAHEIEVYGKVVMPGFVDSHTHLVYGPPRLSDYEMRLAGCSYAEITAGGGGILSSVRSVRTWSTRRLEQQARRALDGMAMHGTTSVEAKSGYGLDEASETKLLRAANHWDARPLDIYSTFLGAHVVPPEFHDRADAYIDWLRREMLPFVARRRMARFADIYCDTGAFTVEQARRYLTSAREAGLGLRIHASQFENLGAVQLAVELGAISADHLDVAGEPEIRALAGSSTMATLLPGCVFHLGLDRYAPARRLIESGAAVALATDFNPGSSPTFSMQMMLSLACAQMRMTPAEAIVAATINGAHALGIADQVGSLEFGKQADLLVLSVSDYREIPYHFGVNQVDLTFKNGVILQRGQSIEWDDDL
jgi:imidazolonepropionase